MISDQMAFYGNRKELYPMQLMKLETEITKIYIHFLEEFRNPPNRDYHVEIIYNEMGDLLKRFRFESPDNAEEFGENVIELFGHLGITYMLSKRKEKYQLDPKFLAKELMINKKHSTGDTNQEIKTIRK